MSHSMTLYTNRCACSEDLDQPAHWHNLMSLFDSCAKTVQRKFSSDCADAHTEQSVSWVKLSEGTFSYITAQL